MRTLAIATYNTKLDDDFEIITKDADERAQIEKGMAEVASRIEKDMDPYVAARQMDTDEIVALGEGGLEWTPEELAAYIPNAKKYIDAKTSMTPQKLKDVNNVIAFLAQFGPEAAAE